MQDELQMTILKQDLEILHNEQDKYLLWLLKTATQMITKEGIILTEDYLDTSLVCMYAAYLYRKRGKDDNPMPRMLRYALNNRLWQQKGGLSNDG